MKNLALIAALLLSSMAAQAQYSLKVFDINQTTVQGGSSYAGGFTAFKGRTYFYATDGIHGNELWWTNGDTVVMVADIAPGGFHGVTPNSDICVLNGKLYFSAADSLRGTELFEYDGVHPPLVAADIVPGPGSGSPHNFTMGNGLLYFMSGWQIWAYDPGLHKAYPINSSLSDVSGAVVFGDKIVLGATNFPYNVEPCEINLNDNSFRMLQDLNVGIYGSHPTQFMTAFGRVFFVASTPADGVELYQYTGAGQPQRLTGNINPGSGNSVAHTPGFRKRLFIPYNNKLYFAGNVGGVWFDLCYYDPNVGKASVVYTMAGSQAASEFEEYRGRLFFATDSNKNGITGMYVYDGSAAYSISAFGVPNTFENPRGTTAANGRLFFSADGSTGNEVYVFTDSAALAINPVTPAPAAVKLYPNPAADEANLEITLGHAQQLDIRLSDITGKTVYSTGLKPYAAAGHKITLPLRSLTAGNYVFTVIDARGNVLHSGKMMKE